MLLIFSLQICAINMRNATYDLAARVLQQCGNNLTLCVQYNPDSKSQQQVKICYLSTVQMGPIKVQNRKCKEKVTD